MMIEFRNPTYNAVGSIDCEINHSQLGWIPFTASPDDPEQHGRDVYTEAIQGEVAPYVPMPVAVTGDQIIAGRGRRLSLGFDYDFGDARGVHHIGTTPDDMVGWDEVTKVANAMLATSTPGTITIVTNTGPTEVTPLEWQAVLVAAGAARQPIWQASFVLQAMDPIPADYATNPAYWPAG